MKLSPELAQLVFWICVASCAFAQVAIVVSTWRGTRPLLNGGAAEGAPSGEKRIFQRAPQLMWAIIPAIALVFVFAGTWNALTRVSLNDTAPMHEEHPGAVAGSATLIATYTLPPVKSQSRPRKQVPPQQLSTMVDQAVTDADEPQGLFQQ